MECQDTLSFILCGRRRAPCGCAICRARMAYRQLLPGLFQIVMAPSGEHVGAVVVRSEGYELWTGRPDGSGLQRLCVGDTGEELFFPCFTADSRHLLFSLESAAGCGLRRVSLAPPHCIEPLTRRRDWGALPLPDLRRLVCFRLRSERRGHLILLNLISGDIRRLTSRLGTFAPVEYCPREGRLIYMEERRGRNLRLSTVEL